MHQTASARVLGGFDSYLFRHISLYKSISYRVTVFSANAVRTMLIKKLIDWIRGKPRFVLREHELSDPFKVQMRDALNDGNTKLANHLMQLAEEKKHAEEANKIH